MINSRNLEDRNNENSGASFSCPNSQNLANLQTPKLKPRRPIILLRRNSLGNIPIKNENRKKSAKCPRLKSMENIHIKPKLLPLPLQKVKVENIMEFNSYEALNSPSFIPANSENYNLANGVKLERFDSQFPNASNNSTPYLFNTALTPISNTSTFQQNQFLTPNRNNQTKVNYPTGNQQYFKQEAGQFYHPNLPPNNDKHYQNQMLVSTPIGQHHQIKPPNNTHQPFIVNSQKNQNIEPFSQPNEINQQYNIVPQAQQQQFAHNSQPEYLNQFKMNYFNPNINQGGVIHQTTTDQPNFPQNNTSSNQIVLNSNSQWQLRPNSNICESIVDDSLTNITWLGKMGVNNFMPVPLERERKFNHETKLCRPPYSYTALIQFAINSSPTGRMTLRQIYQWIEDKFPFFKTAKPGWKNSIRHNLSLHDIFVREVTTGSKASFWTLRPDLNQRPLTLDSVVSVDSLQGFNQGQKPILPRLPQCSQPYILLPIPLLQQQNENGMAKQQQHNSTQNQSIDMSLNATSLNNFTHDSGFNSDLSHCTPSSSGSLNTPQSSGHLEFISEKKEVSPMFPSSNRGFAKQNVQKRSRKEPLKTLNDSLNSSITFLKENEESIPRPRVPLSPSSGHQFLLCKKKKSKNKSDNDSSTDLGFSDESFSELLNGLGSPFSALFNNPAGLTPKFIPERKRRRSWGSPESTGSGGNFRATAKQENETTPPGVRIRRVKSEALDLHREMKNVERPTSTPVCKNKWSNVEKQSRKSLKMEDNENKENEFGPAIENKKMSENDRSDAPLRIPSPIPLKSPEYGSDFFQDIMGTLFKTPDKPSVPSRHFESLTPVRAPFSDITLLHNTNDNPGPSTTPSKIEDLDNSFGKMLDLSAGSGCFNRLNNQFSNDANDLNLSWSNFSHL